MRTSVTCILLLFAVQALFSCASEEITGETTRNRAPEAWLSIAPPERADIGYRAHMYWGGWDPDGEVDFFEYSITNNDGHAFDPADTTGVDKWHRTAARDSVFLFSADVPKDSAYFDLPTQDVFEFSRSHTFFVRAVDKQGARSVPDYRSFTSHNLSPVVVITEPPNGGLFPANVPPIITFRWIGRDYVSSLQDPVPPDSVRSILVDVGDFGWDFDQADDYIRNTPDAPEWTEWRYYNAPDEGGRTWFPPEPLAYSYYVFAVQVKDEAGAVSPVFDIQRNMRRVQVTGRRTGPILTVYNRFMSPIKTSAVSTTILRSIDLPAGVPVQFEFEADAASYGGTVTGYRYGWDMQDLSIDEQWEVDYTPFVGNLAQSAPRKWFFGTHTFFVEVKDNSDLRSRVGIVVNIVPFTMERDLLLVDDFFEGNSPGFLQTKGQMPSDAEHDAFWDEVLQNVTYDVYPSIGNIKPIPLTTLALYKAIIWSVWAEPLSNSAAVLGDQIRFGSNDLNLISPYLEAGGKLMICGEHPMTMVIDHNAFPPNRWGSRGGPAYPFVFLYELAGNQAGQDPIGGAVGGESFAYNDCCLNVVDVTDGVNFQYQPRQGCTAFGSPRTYEPHDVGIRRAAPLDRDFGFPHMLLRPEVSDPNRYYHESVVGLSSDIYNPPYLRGICPKAEIFPRRSCFQPMYGLICLDQESPLFRAPIGFWTSRWADIPNPYGVAGRSVVWGFAPVFFVPNQVRRALELILFKEWQLTPSGGYTFEAAQPAPDMDYGSGN